MSKIGKINVLIPEKVKVVQNGNLLNIEGPLGKKTLNIDTDTFDLKIEEGKAVSLKPKNLNQAHLKTQISLLLSCPFRIKLV